MHGLFSYHNVQIVTLALNIILAVLGFAEGRVNGGLYYLGASILLVGVMRGL